MVIIFNLTIGVPLVNKNPKAAFQLAGIQGAYFLPGETNRQQPIDTAQKFMGLCLQRPPMPPISNVPLY